MKKTKKVKEFLEYFNEFYGSKGMYPNMIPGYTEKQVLAGILVLGKKFEGDTFDRETIRDMIRMVTLIEHCLIPREQIKKFYELTKE